MSHEDVLHITNGDSLTAYLKELDFKGTFLTWQEMLCEGPTVSNIESDAFYEVRNEFLSTYFNLEVDEEAFKHEMSKLDNIDDYSEITLWFEYDLFCHINMLGVLKLLHQRKVDLPVYLVCSGRIPGEKDLKGLPELTPEQLLQHFKKRILLTDEDRALAVDLWRIYCGHDHNLFKPYIVQSSSFEYMSPCLKAHLERFPDSKTGLGAIETNILSLVRDREVKSKHHLLGYALNYQGYYGYGDLQLERIIDNLEPFLNYSDDGIKLNRKGHEALLGKYNVASEIGNDIEYGGVSRMRFQFSKTENKLVKTISNVN